MPGVRDRFLACIVRSLEFKSIKQLLISDEVHHLCGIMLQQLNVVIRLTHATQRLHTCVKEKGGYFEHKL